ncbi:unnamed protein product, partial [Rhizoctonia solani]
DLPAVKLHYIRELSSRVNLKTEWHLRGMRCGTVRILTTEDVPTTKHMSATSTRRSIAFSPGKSLGEISASGTRFPASSIIASVRSSVPAKAGHIGERVFGVRCRHLLHSVSSSRPCISIILPCSKAVLSVGISAIA